jgi:hypothetical protein
VQVCNCSGRHHYVTEHSMPRVHRPGAYATGSTCCLSAGVRGRHHDHRQPQPSSIQWIQSVLLQWVRAFAQFSLLFHIVCLVFNRLLYITVLLSTYSAFFVRSIGEHFHSAAESLLQVSNHSPARFWHCQKY